MYFLCVCVSLWFSVCVAVVGLAEMSQARSHALSGAADIATATWRDGGAYRGQ